MSSLAHALEKLAVLDGSSSPRTFLPRACGSLGLREWATSAARAFRRDAFVVIRGLRVKDFTSCLRKLTTLTMQRKSRAGVGDGMELPTRQVAARNGCDQDQDRLRETSGSHEVVHKSLFLTFLRLPETLVQEFLRRFS